MLKAFNVPFVVSDNTNCKYITISEDHRLYGPSLTEFVSGDPQKVESYCNFYTYYSFDTNGCFLHIGIFE